MHLILTPTLTPMLTASFPYDPNLNPDPHSEELLDFRAVLRGRSETRANDVARRNRRTESSVGPYDPQKWERDVREVLHPPVFNNHWNLS